MKVPAFSQSDMRLATEDVNSKAPSIAGMMRPPIEMAKVELEEKLTTFAHRKRVADYLIGKGLGEGSFAKVHFGLHTITGEEVAIKVMNKAKARKDAYVHRNLRREGRILQLTRHRNVVQVYDVLETDNNYYVVTELCCGGDLIDMVTEKGCLPEKDVQSYVTQLTSAVVHLHSKGIVHRDLKVENMLLDGNGRLKLIDFGLSNTIAHSCIDKSSALATQCGSPAYAAPELLAKKKYGPKADVWSIGVITFALLVGKLPFTVEPFRIPKLCRKMIRGEMNPLPSHISTDCRFFIAQLLNPDPKSRPTADHVAKLKWIARSYVKLGLYTPDKVDTEVAAHMSDKLGLGMADVLSCVAKNRPGESLATYYLLSARKNRIRNNLGMKMTAEAKRTTVSRSTIGSDGNLHHSKTDSEKSMKKEEQEDRNNNTLSPRKDERQTLKTEESYLEHKVRELKKKFNISVKNGVRNDDVTQPINIPHREIVPKTPVHNSDKQKITLNEFSDAVAKYDGKPETNNSDLMKSKSNSSKTISRALEALQRVRAENRSRENHVTKQVDKNEHFTTNKGSSSVSKRAAEINASAPRPFSTPELRLPTASGRAEALHLRAPCTRRSVDLAQSPPSPRRPNVTDRHSVMYKPQQKTSVLSQKYMVSSEQRNNNRTPSPCYVYNRQTTKEQTGTKFPALNGSTSPPSGTKFKYTNGVRPMYGKPLNVSSTPHKNRTSAYNYHYNIDSVANKFQGLLNNRNDGQHNIYAKDNMISNNLEQNVKYSIKR